MLERLIGVGLGGAIGVASTVAAHLMQHRKEREMQRRKEVLPIASIVLAAVQEAWDTSAQYRDSPTAMSSMRPLMKRNYEARNQLLIALDELALLIPDIEEETLALIGSTSISPEALETYHDQQLDNYLDASTALQERVREILKTIK